MTRNKVIIGSFSEAARDAAGTVVIIDVFRAFTTAAIALSNGAARIIMVDDLQAALDLRDRKIGDYCIGERGGIKPANFDYGNSPAEIADIRFDGKTLIQTTSNGTRGILAATKATRIYAGSLVTAPATARAILAGPPTPVTLVAMGVKDERRANEDEVCARYLQHLLNEPETDPGILDRMMGMITQADTDRLSAQDVECCLRGAAVSFAIRVRQEDGLCVATAYEAPISLWDPGNDGAPKISEFGL